MSSEVRDMIARQMAERWEWMCGQHPAYTDTDIDRLPMAPGPLATILSWKYNPRGMVIFGESGAGKTRAVFLLLKRLTLEDGIPCRFFHCTEFGNDVSAKFGESSVVAKSWLDRLAIIPVMVFDDLGKERLTDRGEAEFFGLIERRFSKQYPTIITTNHPTADAVGSMFGQDRAAPLVRRLREYFTPVKATKETSK